MYVQYLQGTYKCYSHRAQTMGERKTPHPPPLPSALLPPNPFIFTEIDYIRRSAHFVKPPPGGPPPKSLENTDTNRPIILCYTPNLWGGDQPISESSFLHSAAREQDPIHKSMLFFFFFPFITFCMIWFHRLISPFRLGHFGSPHPHFNQPGK